MESNEEFKMFYDGIKKELLKDAKSNINFEDLKLDEFLNTLNYEDFFEDKEFIGDLINFLSTYNRTTLINSPIYQKQKALFYFKDFIAFNKIQFNFNADKDNAKQNYSNLNTFLTIHPEKNEILNLSEDILINDGTKTEE